MTHVSITGKGRHLLLQFTYRSLCNTYFSSELMKLAGCEQLLNLKIVDRFSPFNHQIVISGPYTQNILLLFPCRTKLGGKGSVHTPAMWRRQGVEVTSTSYCGMEGAYIPTRMATGNDRSATSSAREHFVWTYIGVIQMTQIYVQTECSCAGLVADRSLPVLSIQEHRVFWLRKDAM